MLVIRVRARCLSHAPSSFHPVRSFRSRLLFSLSRRPIEVGHGDGKKGTRERRLCVKDETLYLRVCSMISSVSFIRLNRYNASRCPTSLCVQSQVLFFFLSICVWNIIQSMHIHCLEKRGKCCFLWNMYNQFFLLQKTEVFFGNLLNSNI